MAHDGIYDSEEVLRAQRVRLAFLLSRQPDAPRTSVAYELVDGDRFVTVTTRFENTHDAIARVPLRDSLRADRSFEFGMTESPNLFWAYDEWFRQAYGIVVPRHSMKKGGDRTVLIEYLRAGDANATIASVESLSLERYVFPADDLLGVRAIAHSLPGLETQAVSVRVRDVAGPVGNAKVTIAAGDANYGLGRTGTDGRVSFALPAGDYVMKVEGLGRPAKTITINPATSKSHVIELEPCGFVAAHVTDKEGEPIPCKVAFYGRDGTADPYFGPDSGAIAVHNLYYSHNGRFRQEIGPGKYDVIVSYGPKYDIVATQLEVERGKEAHLEAELVRSVQTRGWISSDFHSHSSPSGDNTSSQLGRVLNLLCEHIEFAPCTEHNRLSTYAPHLQKLGASHLLATCVGLELTGRPGSVNHKNAFPLVHRPRTQDAGAPLIDEDPVVQIERLALWDGGSDKLVQTNHPSIPQIFGDRDQDTKPDGGFQQMFGFMDVIEVHPPEAILSKPKNLEESYRERNAMFHWMQLLNLGYRIPGIVNTDAHYNFHGSGGLGNYLKYSTDDPAEIGTMEMVHAAEAGHVIMTNGPFMEVSLRTESKANGRATRVEAAIPGDEVVSLSATATLSVRVQCPNWFDINRVQVYLNGRPNEERNFTRRSTPGRFSDGVVKFDSEIALELTTDTHVIVVAVGEGLTLGRTMGPNWGKNPPVAVSNPIFVDSDGNGFQPNKDMLDVPLPQRAK